MQYLMQGFSERGSGFLRRKDAIHPGASARRIHTGQQVSKSTDHFSKEKLTQTNYAQGMRQFFEQSANPARYP